MANVHVGISEASVKMVGIKTLTTGYTKDMEPLNLNEEERAKWLDQGWRLEGKTAYKTLVMVVMNRQGSAEGEKILE